MTKVSVITSMLQQTAQALHVIEVLGKKVQTPGIIKGKQTDYARRALLRGLGTVFVALYPATPFNVITRRQKKPDINEREFFPDGPAVQWCRAVLTTAPDRVVKPLTASLPEMFELKEWAARPDALPKVIEKLNAKTGPKSAEQKR